MKGRSVTARNGAQIDYAETPSPWTGHGSAFQHHGEMLQGIRRDERGIVRQCLVSFPRREAGSRAFFVPDESGVLNVRPQHKHKAVRAAAITLNRLGRTASGRLLVECEIPVGLGLGSSTSDVVATVKAVSAAYRINFSPEEIAEIAVEAEAAVDPVMFDDVVLFAQREGRVLESFGNWFPEFAVLSVDIQPESEGIDTLSIPDPHYTLEDENRFDVLIESARAAFAGRNARAVAAIATKSAELNQSRLPMRRFSGVIGIAERSGAWGVQISHSGTIAGLLFAPGTNESHPYLLSETRRSLKAIGAVARCLFMTQSMAK